MNEISLKQKEIIIGSLLGDGSLTKPIKMTHNPCYRVLRSTNDHSYLEWQYKELQNLCSSEIKDRIIYDHRTDKHYYHSRFNTRCSAQFREMRNEWYDPAGHKTIPENLSFTPLSIAIWFCDDGNFHYSKSRILTTAFSTDCFSANEVDRLSALLNQFLQIELFYRAPHERGFVIKGSTEASLVLANTISQNVIDMSMGRKLESIRHYLNKQFIKPRKIDMNRFDQIILP